MTRTEYLLVSLALCAAMFGMRSAHAQYSGTYNGMPTQVVGPYEQFPRSTPPDGVTVSNASTSSGVASQARGTATATMPTGTRVAVPVKATASIPRADVASAAAKRGASAVLGPVGAVATVAALADLLAPDGDSGGYVRCGFMEMLLCEQRTEGGDLSLHYQVSGETTWFTSGQAACEPWASVWPGLVYWNVQEDGNEWGYSSGCYQPVTGGYSRKKDVIRANRCSGGTAPDLSLPPGEQCGPGTVVTEPASEPELQQSLQEKLDAEFEASRQLYEALKADQAAVEAAQQDYPDEQDPLKDTTPVDVDDTPVVGPKEVVGTRTIDNGDGTTSTETTEKQTTITPTQQGTTVADTTVGYKSSTVITTTTINNVTNVTNIETETVEETPRDDCAATPDTVACKNLGAPPVTEDIPTQEIPVTYSPVSFASAAGCPAPITYDLGAFGGSQVISYEPMCDWLTSIRPLFLALGALACAWIFMESLRA